MAQTVEAEGGGQQGLQPVVRTKETTAWSGSRRNQTRATQLIAYIIVTVGAIIFMIPFVWMLSSSLKPLDQIFGAFARRHFDIPSHGATQRPTPSRRLRTQRPTVVGSSDTTSQRARRRK